MLLKEAMGFTIISLWCLVWLCQIHWCLKWLKHRKWIYIYMKIDMMIMNVNIHSRVPYEMNTTTKQIQQQVMNQLQGYISNISITIYIPGNSLWPFWDGEVTLSRVKWPPTRGWKGHFESPGMNEIFTKNMLPQYHLSNNEKTLATFHYAGWLIGILSMAY